MCIFYVYTGKDAVNVSAGLRSAEILLYIEENIFKIDPLR